MDEYEELKREMEKLAVVLEALDDELESELVSGILRCLLDGLSAESIVEEFDLEQLGGA